MFKARSSRPVASSGEQGYPAKEQFANVHYRRDRRAFLLLRGKSNLFWTRVISYAKTQ
jgi:hypothetical protein